MQNKNFSIIGVYRNVLSYIKLMCDIYKNKIHLIWYVTTS